MNFKENFSKIKLLSDIEELAEVEEIQTALYFNLRTMRDIPSKEQIDQQLQYSQTFAKIKNDNILDHYSFKIHKQKNHKFQYQQLFENEIEFSLQQLIENQNGILPFNEFCSIFKQLFECGNFLEKNQLPIFDMVPHNIFIKKIFYNTQRQPLLIKVGDSLDIQLACDLAKFKQLIKFSSNFEKTFEYVSNNFNTFITDLIYPFFIPCQNLIKSIILNAYHEQSHCLALTMIYLATKQKVDKLSVKQINNINSIKQKYLRKKMFQKISNHYGYHIKNILKSMAQFKIKENSSFNQLFQQEIAQQLVLNHNNCKILHINQDQDQVTNLNLTNNQDYFTLFIATKLEQYNFNYIIHLTLFQQQLYAIDIIDLIKQQHEQLQFISMIKFIHCTLIMKEIDFTIVNSFRVPKYPIQKIVFQSSFKEILQNINNQQVIDCIFSPSILQNMMDLRITNMQLNIKWFQQLMKNIPNKNQIKILDFSGCTSLGDTCVFSISSYAAKLQKLEELKIGYKSNGINATDESLEILIKNFQYLTKLMKLDLSGNVQISVLKISEFISFLNKFLLERQQKIFKLKLKFCDISIQNIKNSLPVNFKLSELLLLKIVSTSEIEEENQLLFKELQK